MIIHVSMDRMGAVIIRPKAAAIRRRAVRLLATNGCENPRDDIFIQEGESVQEVLSLSDSQMADLRAGWNLRLRADSWLVGNLYGYDLCNSL
jgi:hypothetical protein